MISSCCFLNTFLTKHHCQEVLTEEQNQLNNSDDAFKYEDTGKGYSQEKKHLQTEDESSGIAEIENNFADFNSSSINEVNQKVEELYERINDGEFKCKLCCKIQKRKDVIKKHIETHMNGLSFPCNLCGKDFMTRNAAQQHYSRNHPGKKFSISLG